MSEGSWAILSRDVEVVADAVRVEHLDRVDRRARRDLPDQACDEGAVAGLGVAVAVALDVPHVVAAGRALDALEPLVLEHAGVEDGDLGAGAVAGVGRALRQRGRQRGRARGRAGAALDARLAGEADRRRGRDGLAGEHVVRRDAGRALRTVGSDLADALEHREHVAGRIAEARLRVLEQRQPERTLLRHPPTAQHARDVGRVARPGDDLPRPQQERVRLIAVDGDLGAVPLARKVERGGGGRGERREGDREHEEDASGNGGEVHTASSSGPSWRPFG